jgi:hypothetical protein
MDRSLTEFRRFDARRHMLVTSLIEDYDHARSRNSAATIPKHKPWNMGKLIGAKPPLRPKHVWSIRTKLQVEERMRDLAVFNLAIDRKLRGCDVVALRVEDIAPHGYAGDRATVRQRKTGQSVWSKVTEQIRQAVDNYIRATGKNQANSYSAAGWGWADA